MTHLQNCSFPNAFLATFPIEKTQNKFFRSRASLDLSLLTGHQRHALHLSSLKSNKPPTFTGACHFAILVTRVSIIDCLAWNRAYRLTLSKTSIATRRSALWMVCQFSIVRRSTQTDILQVFHCDSSSRFLDYKSFQHQLRPAVRQTGGHSSHLHCVSAASCPLDNPTSIALASTANEKGILQGSTVTRLGGSLQFSGHSSAASIASAVLGLFPVCFATAVWPL